MNFQDQQKVSALLRAILEASIYHAPTDPGLTSIEILEVGRRIGLQAGEIGDAISQVATPNFADKNARLLPNHTVTTFLMHFAPPQEPDYRNPKAFEFVFAELHASARAYGARNAKLERSVVVERALSDGLSRLDIEAAITIMILADVLIEKIGILSFSPGKEGYATPVAQTSQQRQPQLPIRRNEALARVYPIVKDVIDRRVDGRPVASEPFDAFAEQLTKLGYGSFRLWWIQLVRELQQASTQTSPVMVTVLAGALVEGSLAFVVKHARQIGLGVMGSKTFEESPTRWRIDDLVSSATAGGESAILDTRIRHRAEGLIRTRQRIHAGRMLVDFPGGPPDLRPEEARDAQATAEQVVRCVLDWLQRHPATA